MLVVECTLNFRFIFDLIITKHNIVFAIVLTFKDKNLCLISATNFI